MTDSYVCSKAKIKCSCGDKISTLTVFPDRTIWLTGEPQANISDHISMRNIAPFGKCHTTAYPATGSATAANHGTLTPMPCVPNTPFPWMGGKDDVILKGYPALLKSSKCKCIWGGTITFTFEGQTEGNQTGLPEERALNQNELDEETKIEISSEDILDGIQLVLDAAGMTPILGAAPDLLNASISACRGDWANAGLSLLAAVPGIGDAAGAAKIAKNGAKIAQKSKKIHKVSSAGDELALARAKKQSKIQQEKLIEQGIAEGKVARFETKQNVIIKKEATNNKTIEINQPASVSRIETTTASSINPFRKITPTSQPAQTGSSTSYGSGNRDFNMSGNNGNGKPKENPKEKTQKDKDKKIIPEESGEKPILGKKIDYIG